jgi:hypothetical protein
LQQVANLAVVVDHQDMRLRVHACSLPGADARPDIAL